MSGAIVGAVVGGLSASALGISVGAAILGGASLGASLLGGQSAKQPSINIAQAPSAPASQASKAPSASTVQAGMMGTGQAGGAPGVAQTMLTGAGGIDPTKLNLGRNTLLGQ
jgi:hypothetical protein